MRSRPTSRSRLLLHLVPALVAMLVATQAHAAQKGLSTDLTWGISSADQDRTLAATQDLGAGWLRLNMSWADVETRDNAYSSRLAMYDDAISKASSSGARLLVTVYQSPPWASGATNPETPPLDPAKYAEFLAYVADRYRGQVQAWQVWNEPNFKRFWSTGPDPARYARLLKAAHGAIKGVDPGLTVVFGGLSLNDYGYLEAAYRAMPDLGNYYDVMASHPYTLYPVASPDTVIRDASGRISSNSFAGYREVHRTMAAHGDHKPLWLTEMGWSTTSVVSGVSEATQAAYLTRAYDCIEQDSYVQVAFWYTFRNNYWARDADTWEDQLGLVRTDFSRKPAYDAYKSYAPDSSGCDYKLDGVPLVTDPVPDSPSLQAPPPAVTEAAGDTDRSAATTRTGATPGLAVRRAQVHDGGVAIAARVVQGATGTVGGVIAYDGVSRKFSVPVARDGTIAARVPLGADASPKVVWVALSYSGDARFHRQGVILHAAPRRARLRVRRSVTASSVSDSWTVTGRVNRRARGRVALVMAHRTFAGQVRMVTARTRIRDGRFSYRLELPAGVRDAVAHVIFPGDPARGVGGASAIRIWRAAAP